MGVNLLSQFEQKQIEKLNNNRRAVFESGDTVKVNVRMIQRELMNVFRHMKVLLLLNQIKD